MILVLHLYGARILSQEHAQRFSVAQDVEPRNADEDRAKESIERHAFAGWTEAFFLAIGRNA